MASPNQWAQQLKANIELVAEIAVPLISISVAVYVAYRRCTGRIRPDPEGPNEGPAVIIEMQGEAENEFAHEKPM